MLVRQIWPRLEVLGLNSHCLTHRANLSRSQSLMRVSLGTPDSSKYSGVSTEPSILEWSDVQWKRVDTDESAVQLIQVRSSTFPSRWVLSPIVLSSCKFFSRAYPMIRSPSWCHISKGYEAIETRIAFHSKLSVFLRGPWFLYRDYVYFCIPSLLQRYANVWSTLSHVHLMKQKSAIFVVIMVRVWCTTHYYALFLMVC